MPLVYLPEREALFLWGSEATPRELPALASQATAHSAVVVTPEGRRQTAGLSLPLLETVAMLAVVPAAVLETLPASVATWTLASKLAIELVSRERLIPTITRQHDRIE